MLKMGTKVVDFRKPIWLDSVMNILTYEQDTSVFKFQQISKFT